MKDSTYEGRIKQDLYLHQKKLTKLYFVRDGKRVDRVKQLENRTDKMFGHFISDMNVIFSQRVFNLNYRCERLDMAQYTENLNAIKEKYSITKNGDNQVIVCNSLMYGKKKKILYIDRACMDYAKLERELRK